MKKVITIIALLFLVSTLSFAQNAKKITNTLDKGKVVKNAVQNTNATTYDFTTGSNKFYGGTAGAKEVQAGVWGMIAGDANGDGGVSGPDYTSYQNAQGNEGYDVSDFNLDGGVSGPDYTLYQNNQGSETKVPN